MQVEKSAADFPLELSHKNKNKKFNIRTKIRSSRLVSTIMKLARLLLGGSFFAKAQIVPTSPSNFLDGGSITVAWEAKIGPIEPGNGALFISSSSLSSSSIMGNMLVIVRKDAVVQAFHPTTGSELWTYSPPDNTTSSSIGGAFFSSIDGQDYILFSATTNANYPTAATR
jgi:outer membrane protein assembly factor BamB